VDCSRNRAAAAWVARGALLVVVVGLCVDVELPEPPEQPNINETARAPSGKISRHLNMLVSSRFLHNPAKPSAAHVAMTLAAAKMNRPAP
jgi:hypothetical protein